MLKEYDIKMPNADICNTRLWEKQNIQVNLESLKGGSKQYTIYTDGSKKEQVIGGGFIVNAYNKPNSYSRLQNARSCHSIPGRVVGNI